MKPKKVTIHFNNVRVVVPCHPEMLVSDLIDAATNRYEKFSNRILAIYDEPSQNISDTVANKFNNGLRNSSTVIRVKNANGVPKRNGSSKNDEDEIIEVVSFSDPSINVEGLRVVSDAEHCSQPSSSGYSQMSSNEFSDARDSLRSNLYKPSGSIKMNKIVTYSPDVFKRNISSNQNMLENTSLNLSRNTARKSMITDAFLDAKERLEERLGKNVSLAPENMKSFEVSLCPDFVGHPLGIEISAVPDPNDTKGNRLLAVEIIRIDEDGRVAKDGRIKVGDQITHINDRPMSLARARAYLHDLRTVDEPKLIVERQHSSGLTNSNSELSQINIKPIVTPLQQANTTQLGNTFSVSITKGKLGFGFSVASRFSAKNERLFYISTVKLGGPATNSLKIGDRLLQINGQELGDLEQHEVVSKLKEFKVGEAIMLLASRLATETSIAKELEPISLKDHTTSNNISDSNMDTSMKSIRAEMDENLETLHFNIPLNDSPSAGLGISLKAQKVYKDGLAIDCGLYIKKILQGSAAFKDGRLKKDDRLIGIEEVDLRRFERNGEALEAFMKCLTTLPLLSSSVNVFVARKKHDNDKPETFVVNRAVFPPTSNLSLPKGGPPLSNDEREERLTKSEDESDTASVIPEEEPFARDKITRKSMSEKRSFGISNDPFHTQTFLKIKHQRQTSAPLIANVNQSDDAGLRRLLGGRRCASLSKHRFTIAPNTIHIENEQMKNPVDNNKKTIHSFIEKKDFSTIINPCLTGQENFAPTSSLFANLLKRRKNRKESRQTLLSNGEVASDDSGKENTCQLISASPKRRSISLEPITASKVVDNIPNAQLPTTSNANRPKVFPAPSFKAAMSNSESHSMISGSQTENGKSKFLAEINDKQTRRKSTGNALLKLFRSREGSPEKPSLRVGDEEEAFKRNLEEAIRNRNSFENMYAGPHVRKNPPPPYKDSKLAYPHPLPLQPHFHKRMYSANETSNSQQAVLMHNNNKQAFSNLQCDEKDLLKHRFKPPEFEGAMTGRTRFYVTSDTVTPVGDYLQPSLSSRSRTIATTEGRRSIHQRNHPSLPLTEPTYQHTKTRKPTTELIPRHPIPTTMMPSTHGLHIVDGSAVGSPRSPQLFTPITDDLHSQPSTQPGLRRTSIPIVQCSPEKKMGIRLSETLQLQVDNRQTQAQLVRPTAMRLHRVPQPESPLEINSPTLNSPSTAFKHSPIFPPNKNKFKKYNELVPLERNDKIEYNRPRSHSTMNEGKNKIFPMFSWSSKHKISHPSHFESSSTRRSMNRRSIPSAIFYDDAEPPVHC